MVESLDAHRIECKIAQGNWSQTSLKIEISIPNIKLGTLSDPLIDSVPKTMNGNRQTQSKDPFTRMIIKLS